jgi:hypothetical protein
MKISAFDSVVVMRNLPEHGLVRGDVGDVLQVHQPNEVRVQFISPVGRPTTIVTLHEEDVSVAGRGAGSSFEG